MYTFAAVLYIACAVIFTAYIWWVSRPWFGIVKNLIRMWVAVLLFVPGYVTEGGQDLAPSFMIVLFTTFTDSWEAAKPAASPMLAALSIATFVIIAVSFVNWVKRPKPETESAQAEPSGNNES